MFNPGFGSTLIRTRLAQGSILLLGQFLFACATLNPIAGNSELQTDASKNYRMDLPVEANCDKNEGVCQKGKGVLVLDPAVKYTLRAKAPGDAKVVAIEDCTGEIPYYELDKNIVLTYTVPEKVKGKLCYLSIQAYAPKYRQSVSLMDIRNVQNPLSAKVLCSQTSTDEKGVAVCQTKIGKLTIIEFQEDVEVFPGPGCDPSPSKEGRLFQFNDRKGSTPYCWRKFLSKSKPEKEFRLTIYPYEEYFIER